MIKDTATKKLKLFNTEESPILLFFILAIFSIGLMSYDHRHQINDNIEQFVSVFNAPIKFIVNTPSRITHNINFYFSNQKKLNNEIKFLQNKINLLLLDAQDTQLLEKENANLRKILQIKELIERKVQVAEIILPNQVNGVAQIIINRGGKDNIEAGSAVINNQGLIGQVIQVSEHTSKIKPITSNQFAISAVSNKGFINTFISGTGNPYLEIKQLPAYEVIKVGDYFLSSGLDEIYPKGIKIGTVSRIIPSENTQFNQILITPFSSPLSFAQVMIIGVSK